MNKKIALVLSGGGARGIAHIGVIEELEKNGFEITSIAGTSMGALVGGVYASGKLNEFKEWLLGLDKIDVFKLIDFTLSKQGIIKGDRVFNKMQEFVPDKDIEELNINYAAIATDITTGKEVVFDKGSLFFAVRASIAIPTVFTPVKYGEALLVDGGVLNNIPINRVKRQKGDILVASCVNADIPVEKPPLPEHEEKTKQEIYLKKIEGFKKKLMKIARIEKDKDPGYFDIINRTISLLIHNSSKLILEQNPPDILVEVSRNICGTFDFYKAEELVETGRYITAQVLKKHFG